MPAVDADPLIEDEVRDGDRGDHDAGYQGRVEVEQEHARDRQRDQDHVDEPRGGAAAARAVGLAARTVHGDIVPRMDLGIRNRVAMVAAASKGLGRAIAEALAAEGCRVSICSRSLESLEE